MNPPIIGPDTLTYKTAPQTWAAGASLSYYGWVPQKGPNGGRVVVDSIDIVAKATSLSNDAAVLEGEDIYRLVKRVQVIQANGRRRFNLRGDALRQYLYHHIGAAEEYADLADSDAQTGTWTFRVPLAKPATLEPFDFSLPADLFTEAIVECGDLSDLSVGSSVVTIAGVTYYLLAHCHEEFSVILHAEDEVVEVGPWAVTSGHRHPVNGRCHELLLYARGAAGGAAMANLTDVVIEELMPRPLLSTPDLLERHLQAKGGFKNLAATDGAVVRNDPAGAGKAVPVISCGPRTSVYDGKYLSEMNIVATNSVASIIGVQRNVLPKSEAIASMVMQKFGLTPAAFRVKTKGKTKRDPREWNKELLAFMPLSARLDPARLR